jgi:hypothetical protein
MVNIRIRGTRIFNGGNKVNNREERLMILIKNN